MAREDHYRYFTFPVTLLQGAFKDLRQVCQNAVMYSLYDYAKNEAGTDKQKINEAAQFYHTKPGVDAYNLGRDLFNSIPLGVPKVSIKTSLIWEFNDNEKDEFELIVFLAFAALKSVLGAKRYGKTNNAFMLARMAGQAKPGSRLPEQIEKYNNRYQLDKIKTELRLNWNLQVYGMHTQGFYFSFKLTLKELVLEAEGKRKSYKLKQLKDQQKQAYTQAIKQLYGK